jgi:cytochrome c oxidase cbb3-type subunit 2
MSDSGYFFPGLLGVFAVSISVSVLVPASQLSSLGPVFKEEEGLISDVYPTGPAGLAAVGRQVYVSEGCQTCHSQLVRGLISVDIDRGWGTRRTVARDYVMEPMPILGTYRLGPDLANVGSPSWRNEPLGDSSKPPKRDASWQFHHLYHPTARVIESTMPAYRHLFEERKITGASSPDALKLPAELQPKAGYEIVPTPAAKALVEYLASLDRSHALREAGKSVPAVASK